MRGLGLLVSPCLGSVMLYTKTQIEQASFLGYNTSEWLVGEDFQEPEFPMLQGVSDSYVQSWFNPGGFTENHLRIPYRFKTDNYSPDDQQKIRDALNDLSSELDQCIEFFDDTETELYRTNFIQIRAIDEKGKPAVPSCSSYVGFVGGRYSQTIQLKPDGCLYPRIIQHEMIHALGFQHEHGRPDRDLYIDVLYKNILPEKHYNFDKMPESNFQSYGQPYDLKSIMHYRGRTFLSDEAKASGERATVVYKGTNDPVMKNHKTSSIDIFEIKTRYSEYCTKPTETLTCGDEENENLYFFSKRKCDDFVDCLNGADESYDMCAESEITSDYVIKTPKVGQIYQYKRVYDNAHDFYYFDFDTTNMINGPYFLSLSTSPYFYKEKWEIELPNNNKYERAALRKITSENSDKENFRNTEKNLVQVKKYGRLPNSLRLVVSDGLIEMTADGQKFIKYEDSSIKKNDLKYLMVSGSTESWTNESGSWERKVASGTWNIKAGVKQPQIATTSRPNQDESTTFNYYW